MSETKLLSLKNLSIQYKTDSGIVKAVNNVSFDLNAGETLGLVGETGAGKTTIAKGILRLLQSPPAQYTGGEILFEGEDLLKASKANMRKVRGGKIFMIFQDPMTALNPLQYVGDQVAEVIKLHTKISKLDAARKAAEVLEMVGIPHERYAEYPHQFSGGMKQRVIIAMALACNPALLLADEPTTALDVTIQAQVLDLMASLKEKYKMAMIMITHDLGIVAKICDRVGIVYAGEIIELGSKEDIFDHYSHPYTKGLFGSLPNLSMKEKRLKPIPGLMPDPANLPEGCKFRPRCPHATDACKSKQIPMHEVSPGHIVRCIFTDKGRSEN